MEKESGSLEIKVLEIGKDYIKLLIKGEDHTFLNLLQHHLLNDEDVVIAKYHISHPLVSEPELYVRTNGKSPLEAIKEANEKIAKECKDLLSQL
jgi:DNA-directed RNA polymerase subunit L